MSEVLKTLADKILPLKKRQDKSQRYAYSKFLGNYETENIPRLYLHSIFFTEKGCNILFTDDMEYPHLDVDTFTQFLSIREMYRNENIQETEYQQILKVQRQALKRGKELLLAKGDVDVLKWIDSEVDAVGIIITELYVLVRLIMLPEKTKEYKISISFEDLFLKEDLWQIKLSNTKADTEELILGRELQQKQIKSLLNKRKTNQ